MPVLLTTSKAFARSMPYDFWCAAGGLEITPAHPRHLPDLEVLLNEACAWVKEDWARLGRRLAADESAVLAHTPTCAGNVSDLGVMLAWGTLAQRWRNSEAQIAVVCDDPWLFRYLASVVGEAVSAPPALWPHVLVLTLRGYVARLSVAARVAAAVLRLRRTRRRFAKNAPILLVYGHPASRGDGQDGYFSDLMNSRPDVRRVLHVDCSPARATELMEDGRTGSLHAWGSLTETLRLPFVRWRASSTARQGAVGWLVRRAAAKEGSTAQAAMIRWQIHCQEEWLRALQPTVVVWPWENHSWERSLAATARRLGIRTAGYQHATIGSRELNHAVITMSDAAAQLPDVILCTGPLARQQLINLGHDPVRVVAAGAWRTSVRRLYSYDPEGPVFVALPADQQIGREMVDAIRPLPARGVPVLVKQHPMTPLVGPVDAQLQVTGEMLASQRSIRAVVYCATTVGLEAFLGGLPTVRFQPCGRVVNDVMPAEYEVPTATAQTVEAALRSLRPPPPVEGAKLFTPPDRAIWWAVLSGAPVSNTVSPPA